MVFMSAGAEDIGLYSVADVVRYSRIPSATARRWLTREGRSSTWRDQLVSFDELVSLLFVREFRRHGVRLADVIAAERDLRARTNWVHPFVHAGLWALGRDVAIRVSEQFIAANRGGQVALPHVAVGELVLLPELVGDVRGQLTYIHDRVAEWRPRDHVVARPALQFGLTCIEGTRVPTRSIYEAVSGGDRPHDVAALYGIPSSMIEQAIEWERQLAA